MKPRIKVFDNGASVHMEKTVHSGFYVVKAWQSSGQLYDRTMCDSYRMACEYFRAFCKIVKGI